MPPAKPRVGIPVFIEGYAVGYPGAGLVADEEMRLEIRPAVWAVAARRVSTAVTTDAGALDVLPDSQADV